MGTPLGDFVRAKRDTMQPEDLGLPLRTRRRAPGLRRSELADRAGISVEYLTRIEQGRDRNPSIAIINTLSDALVLDSAERRHLAYLAKITGGACAGPHPEEPPQREVRRELLATLDLLEPGVAMITNRLGDVLACTSSFALLMQPSGLLDGDDANLTRYVFTDPRAKDTFPDWSHVADEQAFNLWLGPSVAAAEWFKAGLAPLAGPEFTRRIEQHLPPPRRQLRMTQPRTDTDLRWDREVLDTSNTDEQQLVVYLPGDESTAQALQQLRTVDRSPRLRAL
jgi:transcriptional regulator with XRE-family HTH domain